MSSFRRSHDLAEKTLTSTTTDERRRHILHVEMNIETLYKIRMGKWEKRRRGVS